MSDPFESKPIDEVADDGSDGDGTTPTGEVSDSDRQMALLCHLSPLVVGFLGPLVFWLVKKDESAFLDHHGKEAVNFHLTIMIASMISGISVVFLVGILLMPAVLIASIVFSILAAVAANRGEWYRFPITIRMIN